VFLVAWRRWPDHGSAALPWLYTIAQLTTANHLRGKRRHDLAVQYLATVAGRLPAACRPPAEEPAERVQAARTERAGPRDPARRRLGRARPGQLVAVLGDLDPAPRPPGGGSEQQDVAVLESLALAHPRLETAGAARPRRHAARRLGALVPAGACVVGGGVPVASGGKLDDIAGAWAQMRGTAPPGAQPRLAARGTGSAGSPDRTAVQRYVSPGAAG